MITNLLRILNKPLNKLSKQYTNDFALGITSWAKSPDKDDILL